MALFFRVSGYPAGAGLEGKTHRHSMPGALRSYLGQSQLLAETVPEDRSEPSARRAGAPEPTVPTRMRSPAAAPISLFMEFPFTIRCPKDVRSRAAVSSGYSAMFRTWPEPDAGPERPGTGVTANPPRTAGFRAQGAISEPTIAKLPFMSLTGHVMFFNRKH